MIKLQEVQGDQGKIHILVKLQKQTRQQQQQNKLKGNKMISHQKKTQKIH